MTEKELIDGLIVQNKAAIHYLVDSYQNNIIKTAYYFVDNMEDAEDISQEVIMEILKSIGKYQKNSKLYAWIYRITVNRSLDHLRKQKRRSMVKRLESFIRISSDGESRYSDEPATTDTQNDDNEKRKILDTSVNLLPGNQKIAFILSKYDEMSYKEIADVMNLSLSSVESLIFRAKLNLQKKLVNYFSEYSTNNY
ncbi:MAG: RNA polymerase sigma factor [Bacteroidota bacterium]